MLKIGIIFIYVQISGVLLYVGVKECMIGLKRNKGLIIERILVCQHIFNSHKFASLNTKWTDQPIQHIYTRTFRCSFLIIWDKLSQCHLSDSFLKPHIF